MCRPTELQMPIIHPFALWSLKAAEAPRAGVSPSHPPTSTLSAQACSQLSSLRRLPSARRTRGHCAPAQPDPDILTAALCASEARFLSREEKQASPLPRGGKTDRPGQATGSGKASTGAQGWAGHGREQTWHTGTRAPRPLQGSP